LKEITTWLNEEEYKRFLKHIRKRGTSPYAFTKQLILGSIESPKEYQRKMSVFYFFLLYSLSAATVLLVF